MQKYIVKALVFIGMFWLLAGVGAYFWLNTKAGLQASWEAVTWLVPGKLSANTLEGSLSSTVKLTDITYENSKLKLQIGQAELTWQIRAILLGKIVVPVVKVDKVVLVDKEVKAPSTPLTLARFTQLLNQIKQALARMEEVKLTNLIFKSSQAPPISLQQIWLQVNHEDGKFAGLKIEVVGQDTVPIFAGNIKANDNLNWQLSIADLSVFIPNATGTINSSGKVVYNSDFTIIDVVTKVTNFYYQQVELPFFTTKIKLDSRLQPKPNLELGIKSAKIGHLTFKQFKLLGTVESQGLDIKIEPMKLHYTLDQKDYRLNIKTTHLQGEFKPDGLRLTSQLYLNQSDPLNIELHLLKLNQWSAVTVRQPINGTIKWNTAQLDFLSKNFSQIKKIRGRLEVDYNITGELQHPDFFGTVSLSKMSVELPTLNTIWRNGQLDLQGTANQLNYQAKFNAGKGELTLEGQTVFADTQHPKSSKVRINSNNFLLMDNEQYQAFTSADLQLVSQEDLLTVTGVVKIPKGKFNPKYLANNNLPKEIIYVNQVDFDKAPPKPITDFKAHVELNLGDEVDIKLRGLQGKLSGKLVIVDQSQKVAKATGTLLIREGSYDIYGQTLTVTQGTLNFLGGDIVNPHLDIEAIRSFKLTKLPDYFKSSNDELVVGIKVLGMLANPNITLFSEPATLNQSDILSYLIVGHSSEEVTDNRVQILLQAASALSFGQAGEVSGIMSELKSRLGFSEFGFKEKTHLGQTSSTLSSKIKTSTQAQSPLATSTAFILGRYLTPKIYVSYTQSIFDSVNLFRVKYFINQAWSIQSEKSSLGDNSIDIIYSIEK